MPDPPAPTPPAERIEWLDAVRGLAVFGILVVNATLFLWPAPGQALGLPPADGTPDRAARALVSFAFEGKYFTLFSLLFGVGLALQLDRARPAGLLRRRMLALALIGALHVTLLWWGDILLFYGLTGLATVSVRHWAPGRLVRGAALLAVVPVALSAVLAALAGVAALDPDGAGTLTASRDEIRSGYQSDYDAAIAVVREGSWTEQIAARWSDYGVAAIGTTLGGLLALVVAMQWLGVAAWRTGWLAPEARPRWRRLALGALPVALVSNAGHAWLSTALDPLVLDAGFFYQTLAFVVGAVSGSLAIGAGAALWFSGGGPVAAAFATVGRAALSNYLLQSALFTLIAYGLGGYGRIGWAAGLGLTVATFALQVALSRWWLGRFRFGPVEATWRAATYGRWPRLRRGDT